MGEGLGQRGLAVAAGATQRRRNRHGIAIGVEELLFQVELLQPRHEVRWRLRRHHGCALLPALVLQDSDQRRAVFRQIDIVKLAEPARQRAKLAESRPLDRADRLALLAGEPNLAADHGARQGGRRDDENEMLQSSSD